MKDKSPQSGGITINKSVFSNLRMLTTWHCPHSPAAAAAIDRYISCQPGPQQQTCSSYFAGVGPCWDRETDRRTDTVLFHRPCCAYYAGNANKGTTILRENRRQICVMVYFNRCYHCCCIRCTKLIAGGRRRVP